MTEKLELSGIKIGGCDGNTWLFISQSKNISINSNRNQAEDITSFFYPLRKPVSYPNSSQESLFVRGVATEE